MNIFVTHSDPQMCAIHLDDKRVVKMILESAQMLSTAMNVHGGFGPYKSTHISHPCSLWARANQSNYFWLLEHMQFLCMEYSNRYGKTHKCADHIHTFFNARHHIPAGDLTPFVNCTPHKDMDTISAYRLTMKEKWANDKRKPTWKNGCMPSF